MTTVQENKEMNGIAQSVSGDAASTLGGSTLKDDTSLAAPPTDNAESQADNRRKSWAQRIFHHKDSKAHSGEPGSSHHHQDDEEGRKKSIAESGPYIFAFDPRQGKEVLQKNPHWPYEDSYKVEKANEGKWAFGSMMGGERVNDWSSPKGGNR